MNKYITSTLLCIVAFLPFFSFAKEISVFPSTSVMQGEPIRITLSGVKIEKVKEFVFDGISYPFAKDKKGVSGFIGIDLKKPTGIYGAVFILKNGSKISKEIVVLKRPLITNQFEIPKKMGGNTKTAVTKLTSHLSSENTLLNNLYYSPKFYFKNKFQYPLEEAFVTDPYGYSRETVSVPITHKGTDFRAPMGTKVFTMNDGVVRFAKSLIVYGNTVVIDHGGGISTFYMHLSEISVKEGQKIIRGEEIGLSGNTGYTLSPHLHVSVRIHNVSIDPIKFLELFR